MRRTPLLETIRVRADRELYEAILESAQRERESVSNYTRRMLREIVIRQGGRISSFQAQA
jgi:hypothetical protein